VVSIEFHLLYDIVVIFAIAVVVLYLCHRLKIPSIVGFLFTGILAGPYGIALVKSVEQVESIAEIGVIFLLFSIGLEFSFKSLISIKKTILHPIARIACSIRSLALCQPLHSCCKGCYYMVWSLTPGK
jgi:Kef-type K+ transport system membrane component KefB